ncbi:hypothetical protein K7432_003127 [Basidiobolus ranarum]|uniref:BZIP domain-containing protein n=1 Tax=Basidiobolus ranarum TaxID=34480 RepID=A0ABR2W771_9FUNG
MSSSHYLIQILPGLEDMVAFDSSLFFKASTTDSHTYNSVKSNSDSNSLPSTPPSYPHLESYFPGHSPCIEDASSNTLTVQSKSNPTDSLSAVTTNQVKLDINSNSPTFSIFDPKPKSKAGRKRKSEVVDQDVRAKERVIRNRVAAQESRNRQRLYVTELEQKNQLLGAENKILESRLSTVEQEKLYLSKALEAMTVQLVMSQTQAQIQMAEMTNFLFDGFGESAVLTKLEYDKGIHNSLQRKPSTYLRNLHEMTSTNFNHPNIGILWWILIWIFCYGLQVNPKLNEVIDISPLMEISRKILQEPVKELHEDQSSSLSLPNLSLWPT